MAKNGRGSAAKNGRGGAVKNGRGGAVKNVRGGAAKRNGPWLGGARRDGRLLGLILLLGVAAIAGAVLAQGAAWLNGGERPAGASLRISEVMPDNRQTLLTDTGEVPDWIEVENAGAEAVELNNWSLLLVSRPNRPFCFPAQRLEPGESALIYAVGDEFPGAWNAPFRLNASGGEELALLDPNGRTADSVELPELMSDESYQRAADGSWEVCREPSPGGAKAQESAQARTLAGAVEITEVMTGNGLYRPDEDGEYCDYVELHNATQNEIDLTGWHLSDDASRLRRWTFPGLTLPPDGYLLVYCSGKDRTLDATRLHANFRLSGKGEDVYLSDAGGKLVSHVGVPVLLQDQAWSSFEGAWSTELAPTPGLENSRAAAARLQSETFGAALGGVHLSEIMASAVTEGYDWVELRNGSAQAVDLSGWGLSDDSARPRRWQFPQGTVIQPGAYLGVLLTGSASSASSGQLRADFALSAPGGSTVCLSDPQGKITDAVYLGSQYGGISYARFDGREGFRYAQEATPLAANAGESFLQSRAPEPEASVRGGLYQSGERFSVELSAPEGCRVYYTLDCSEPSESSTPYTGPIEISGTTVLRSRAYRDDSLPSYIAAESYLYDVRNESGVYVVSLVSDPSNFYGENAIVSGANLTQDLEREAHVEIFTPGGDTAISQGCGFGLHGMDSRKKPIKSFNLIARSQYGPERFDYPLFSERDYTSYQSLLLRPSGEDQNLSFMRDSVLTSLMRGSSVMFQENEICVVYVNGEYYTLCYLRERINKYGICQFEGWEGMENDIDIIRGNEAVTQGSNASFAELLRWVRSNDMTTDAAYAYVDKRVDIRNYIEYVSAEIFSGNLDLLNVRRYRNSRADGKWRWALYDLDWAFFNDADTMRRWLSPGGVGVRNATDNTLFVACMQNPRFRNEFLTYFGEQLATNFSTENVLAKFQERYERIEPMLAQYQESWGYDLRSGISKVVDYAQARPAKLIGYTQAALKLSDADMEKYFGEAIRKIQESGEENG